MKIRIDYLNKDKEVRHIFTDEYNIGFELVAIMNQWATDIHVYRQVEQGK